MSKTLVDIGTLIVTTPDICGGRPRLNETRITVQRIATWYKMGMTAQEIAAEIPHLDLAKIHAALAYFYLNREQIEADILAEEADYNCLAAEEKIRRSL